MTLSTEQLKLAEYYLDKLNTTNVISKHDVISLEDSLGSNLITSVKSVGYFTNNPSSIGVKDVKEILSKSINTVNAASMYSVEDVLNAVRGLRDGIFCLLNSIKCCYNVSPKVIAALTSDELTTLINSNYSNEDESLIHSMLNYNLIHIINQYPTFLSKVAELHKNPAEVDDIINRLYNVAFFNEDNSSSYVKEIHGSATEDYFNFNSSFLSRYNFLRTAMDNQLDTLDVIFYTDFNFLLPYTSCTLKEFVDFIQNAASYEAILRKLHKELSNINIYDFISQSQGYLNTFMLHVNKMNNCLSSAKFTNKAPDIFDFIEALSKIKD